MGACGGSGLFSGGEALSVVSSSRRFVPLDLHRFPAPAGIRGRGPSASAVSEGARQPVLERGWGNRSCGPSAALRRSLLEPTPMELGPAPSAARGSLKLPRVRVSPSGGPAAGTWIHRGPERLPLRRSALLPPAGVGVGLGYLRLGYPCCASSFAAKVEAWGRGLDRGV